MENLSDDRIIELWGEAISVALGDGRNSTKTRVAMLPYLFGRRLTDKAVMRIIKKAGLLTG